jgi:hypothetical protein
MLAEQNDSSSTQASMVQLVTPIQTLAEQMGAHLQQALQRPGTVGVLTTLMPGIGAEQMVSVPLNAQQFHAVQSILRQIMSPEQLNAPERHVIGFHHDEE